MVPSGTKPGEGQIEHSARGLCGRCYMNARNRGNLRRHRRSRGGLQFVPDTQEGWRHDAACLSADLTLFFPEDRGVSKAKAVCARCPVRRPCLDWAIAAGESWGVWGG